ncbi:MAG: oxidoreductase [Ponticaulis sp.]|nr:oxidoreductase [Ponticaulis sp.]|tara:strand:- start:13114 stop:15642 length:2529 start_codon:yes stop_codon:yes gene_type:complete
MSVAWRIALRELSGGIGGFRIYLACIVLGVAAIAASGSVTEVFTRGLTAEARMLLGGDAMFATSQRRANSEERAFVEGLGQSTEKISLNTMAQKESLRRQVDVTAIEPVFPLIGTVELEGGATNLAEALAPIDNRWGVAVSQSFLDQFRADIGDQVTIGSIDTVIRAKLKKLPDQVGEPGAFGPEALIQIAALEEANRLSVGQLFRSRLIVTFEPGQTFASAETAFKQAYPDSTLRIREPEDAVDGLQNLLGILNNFLTIIGIAALIAGGIGVEQATTAFLQSRIPVIAALKALGATSGTLRTAYFIQLGLLSVIGGLIGLMIGAAAPYLMVSFAGEQLALPQALGIYPVPLFTALVLGLLAAGLFAIPAIGRARSTPPSALFRNLAEEDRTPIPRLERVLAGACLIGLVTVALLISSMPLVTLALLVGAGVSWLIFWGAALLVKRSAARLARTATGVWRLALSNISGPGSLATVIMPSLGLGLALLSLVVLIQANLLRQIGETAPSNAPSLVFRQIPADKSAEFDQLMARFNVDIEDGDAYRRAPFLLVRVTHLKGLPVSDAPIAESERWVVRGETSVTYLGPEPDDTEIIEGEWWPADYSGPLQLSVELGAARGLRLSPGDTIGIRVFGRDLTAEVSSIRAVEWGSFGIGSNTAFVFSPGTLEAANPFHIAIARTDGSQDRALIAALEQDFPDVLVFETRPALEAATKIFEDISLAVNAAASVVTIAGLLVLFGTLGVVARKRAKEAALLKTLGAERRMVLSLYAGEFAIAGGVGAGLGTLIGMVGSYPVIVSVFEARWHFPLLPVLALVGAALLTSAIGGLIVGLNTLSKSPAQVLRSV